MQKTYRTVYLNQKLEKRLEKLAEIQESSVSGVVRAALKQYLRSDGLQGNGINPENRNSKKVEGGQENG